MAITNTDTWNGKEWKDLTVWERAKVLAGREAAKIETAIGGGCGSYGAMRGDLLQKWTGHKLVVTGEQPVYYADDDCIDE